MSTTFRVYRGDTATLSLALVHPFTATPFDPTGWALLATFKSDAGDADTAAVIQKSSAVGGFTVTDAEAGEVDLELVPDDYSLTEGGQRYVFDVQAQNEITGAVKTVFSGILRVQDDVSESTTLSIDTTVVNPSPGYLTAAEIATALAATEAAKVAAEAASAEAATDVVATAGYAAAAANSASSAQTYANAALTRRNDASEFAATAGTSADESAASAVLAAGSASAANTSALAAAASATTAAAAVTSLTTAGTSILRGNGAGGFATVTVGSGLSYGAGTLSLSLTPDIGVATGVRLRLSSTDDATDASGTTGGLGTLGGLSVAKSARVGGALYVTGTSALAGVSATTLSLSGAATFNSTLTLASTLSVGGLIRGANAAAATDASGTTGGIGTIGGLSVAGKTYMGDSLTITGTSNTSSISGPLTLASTLAVTGTSTLTGLLRSTNATAATDATGTTGAVGSLGGASFAKASYFGDTVNISPATPVSALGAELIVAQADRDFSSAGSWTLGTGWSVSGGVCSRGAGYNSGISLPVAACGGNVVGGKYYLYSVTITTTTPGSSVILMSHGSLLGNSYLGMQSGTVNWTAVGYVSSTPAVTVLGISPPSDWAGSIDNVSIKEVVPASAQLELGTSPTTSALRADYNKVFLGASAGHTVTSSSAYLVGIGYNAFRYSAAVSHSVAIGSSCAAYLTAGAGNTFVGAGVGISTFSATDSVGVGRSAMGTVGVGTGITALGAYSLYGLRDASTSTGVGAYSGYAARGSGHVFLGYSAGRYEIGNNTFYVDNQDRTNNTNERVGALLYGTFNATPASQTLRVNASLTALGALRIESTTDATDATGTTGSVGTLGGLSVAKTGYFGTGIVGTAATSSNAGVYPYKFLTTATDGNTGSRGVRIELKDLSSSTSESGPIGMLVETTVSRTSPSGGTRAALSGSFETYVLGPINATGGGYGGVTGYVNMSHGSGGATAYARGVMGSCLIDAISPAGMNTAAGVWGQVSATPPAPMYIGRMSVFEASSLSTSANLTASEIIAFYAWSVTGGPNITTAYGLKLGNVSGAVSNYAIYTGTGKVRFGDDLSLVGALQLGNEYQAGAPTATGYVTLKDSTGTSYKIPAVAA